jgi:pSer/pThr/pTyr-binding forkhead associated (FHA) protein
MQTRSLNLNMDEDKTQPESPPLPMTGPLDGGIHDTFILGKNRSLASMLDKRPAKATDSLLPHTDVTLLVRGIPEHIRISEEKAVVLGRMDHRAKSLQPDVDLTPYGATTRGVSRIHARLFMQDKHLYVTDLHSTNGTYIAGKRLTPEVPAQLSNGMEFLLGSLMIQVVFE